MRELRFFLLGILVPVLTSCGSKPSGNSGSSESTSDHPKAQAASKPVDSIRGRWKAIDGDLPILGDFLRDIHNKKKKIDAGKSFTLLFKKEGELILIQEGADFYSALDYKSLDDNTMVVSQESIWAVIGGSVEDKTKETKKPGTSRREKKLKVKMDGDQLSLTDDLNNVEKYRRLPPAAATIKISELALYSDQCAGVLKEALAKVEGMTDLSIDWQKRTASLKIKNDLEEDAVLLAIPKVGMHGVIEVNGKRLFEFSPEKFIIGGTPPELITSRPKVITLNGIHACCPDCQKVIADQIKGAQVTFEGDGPTKTVKITGDNLDENRILVALWKAGFKVD